MGRSTLWHRFAAFATTSLSFLFAIGPAAQAVEPARPIPRIVQSGFDAYASAGPEAALTAWMKGSPNEGEKYAISEAETFKKAERYMGRYKSYELLDTRGIGATSKLVYFAMNFERGAMFVRFQLYRLDQGWIVQSMDHQMRPEDILPWLRGAEGK